MNESDALDKDRQTIRAALTLAPIGFVQRQLILQMVDRHFDAMKRLAVRVQKLEELANG